MQELLDAVRKATLPAIWSQGVKLARDNAVALVPSAAGEITARVRAPGHAIAPTVTLYVEGLEWSCDCGGKVDPCAHVAAATIAASSGPPTATARDGERETDRRPRLVYRLSTKGRLLTLSRFVVSPDGREERCAGLSSDLVRARLPAGLDPTHDDLRIDRIVGTPPRDVVPLARLADVFACLASAEVTLDRERVTVAGEALMPRAVVRDAPGGGFLLRIERDASVSAIVAMGVARSGDTLRPLGETDLTGAMLERLPLSRTFARDAQAE